MPNAGDKQAGNLALTGTGVNTTKRVGMTPTRSYLVAALGLHWRLGTAVADAGFPLSTSGSEILEITSWR